MVENKLLTGTMTRVYTELIVTIVNKLVAISLIILFRGCKQHMYKGVIIDLHPFTEYQQDIPVKNLKQSPYE